MKAIAYSIRQFEREFLVKANNKKHDLVCISNPLNADTTFFAEGNEAVIIFTNDDASAEVIAQLSALGIKRIITRSTGMDHIDLKAAAAHGITVANVPSYSPQAIAEHAVALAFALNRHLIAADQHSHRFDFRNEGLVGFNFSGKTAGIIGLGATGKATAKIFNGLGCHVIGFDAHWPADVADVQRVTLANLLAHADIISLHIPLSACTKYFIDNDTLKQMKEGVMLINTSRGGLMNTEDLITALNDGKIGYLGMDVYEYEHGLFFEDHENDAIKDPLLQKLMQYPNVIVTPHQAYLTKEALQQIADQTIQNLDL